MNKRTYTFTVPVEFEKWSGPNDEVPTRSVCTIAVGTPFEVSHIPSYGANPDCSLLIEREGQRQPFVLPYRMLVAITNYTPS